ncbi:hypothetical protein [Streptomonospora salina]|uniref:DUF3558 domain-containing protein n=1 Tax=Streptomonospora salina TaxID=104205 RepID=A0A841E8R0_9ACTN|nr:hypothetical protein [Streptomonospora salina]MBB5997498.1 hypothetical protein [Streptomonospora salina]
MRFVPIEGSRTRLAVVAAVAALTAGGCASGPDGSSDAGSPSPHTSATPSPGWSAVGGEPVTGPAPSPDAAEDGEARDRGVDPLPLPASCDATGIEAHMSEAVDRLERPEFTEVRTENRLECSWAGFDASNGSEVVMVTFTPGTSVVDYPGHVPVRARRDDSFFTTEALSAMGGLAKWDAGEMFTGVNLHLPGMLVSTTSNTERIETRALLDGATATAREILAEAPFQEGTSAAPASPAAGSALPEGDGGAPSR